MHLYNSNFMLIYYLAIDRLNVIISGFYAISSLLILYIGHTAYTTKLQDLNTLQSDILKGANLGMNTTATIGIVVASIEIFLQILRIIALPQRTALVLLDISGGSLILLLLVLTMAMAVILGLVAPPVVAYIITATILAPH